MDVKRKFEYDPSVDVTACQIGISKWSWIALDQCNHEDAKKRMEQNRFDVLPVQNADGEIEYFFCTKRWNDYSEIECLDVCQAESIYYRTSLKDLISMFNSGDKHFYFLEDSSQILGLVSFVNLNCQLVYNYMYYVISEIERNVSNALSHYISEEDILNMMNASSDPLYQKFTKKYRELQQESCDNNIYQHLYLMMIGKILVKFNYTLPNHLKSLGDYSDKFGKDGTYNLIRNKVMHPVRPILSDHDSIEQMNELLTDFEVIRSLTVE